MNGKVLMGWAVAVALSISFLSWRSIQPPTPTVHVVTVRDRSLSDREGCSAFTGVVARALDEIGGRRHSSLMMLVSGDEASADEPIDARAPELSGQARRSIDAPSLGATQHAEYLRRVFALCQEAGGTMRSPIYRAVARAVEHVRQQGDVNSRRLVFVQSDLEELSNRPIKDALRNEKRVPDPADLPRIDNTGVEVVFCGTAETSGDVRGRDDRVARLTRSRSSSSVEHVRAVWTAVLTSPTSVKFEPFCPKWQEAPSDSYRGPRFIEDKSSARLRSMQNDLPETDKE